MSPVRMHPARSSSQPPHLVPLVAQLKGSAGRHVMVHVSDAYLCNQNHRCARKEPPHGTRSCAQPRNDSSKVSGLRQGAARDRLRGGPTAPLKLRCARFRLGQKVSGAGLDRLTNARLTGRSLGSGRLIPVRRPRAAQAEIWEPPRRSMARLARVLAVVEAWRRLP